MEKYLQPITKRVCYKRTHLDCELFDFLNFIKKLGNSKASTTTIEAIRKLPELVSNGSEFGKVNETRRSNVNSKKAKTNAEVINSSEKVLDLSETDTGEKLSNCVLNLVPVPALVPTKKINQHESKENNHKLYDLQVKVENSTPYLQELNDDSKVIDKLKEELLENDLEDSGNSTSGLNDDLNVCVDLHEEKFAKVESNSAICANTNSELTLLQVNVAEKQFCCTLCDYKSYCYKSSVKHQIIHNNKSLSQATVVEENKICKICNYQARSKAALAVHGRNHIREQLRCKQCDLKTSRKTLKNRRKCIHNGNTILRCYLCDFETDNSIYLNRHLQTHNGKVKDLCFQCDICGSTLKSKAALHIHMRLHTGERPFHCKRCDYKCTSRSGLNAHKTTHREDKDKPYLCDKCDYKTFRLQRLRGHMFIHTGEKLFKCGLCDYKCSEKYRLIRHKRTHTGEKPYGCEFCDYRCARKSNLNTHIRGVHKKKESVRCRNCGYTCFLQITLEEHIKMKHGGIDLSV